MVFFPIIAWNEHHIKTKLFPNCTIKVPSQFQEARSTKSFLALGISVDDRGFDPSLPNHRSGLLVHLSLIQTLNSATVGPPFVRLACR